MTLQGPCRGLPVSWPIYYHHRRGAERKKPGGRHYRRSRTSLPPRRRTPPRTRVGTREHTYATPRSAVGICDHSHAHGSRTRTIPDHTSHQSVTGQRSTALTVIFSRQSPSRLGQPTEPRGGHTRSLLRMAVGHCSLDHAHHPHGVGAGAGSALSRPSWAACLAQRPRSCDNQ